MAKKPSKALLVLAENLATLMEASPDFKTQPTVAAKAGVNQKTVWRIMLASPEKFRDAVKDGKDFHEPSLDKLAALAAVFKLEPWQLLVPGLDPKALPQLQAESALELQ